MLWNEKTQKFQAFAAVEEILEVKTSRSRLEWNPADSDGAGFNKFAFLEDEKIKEGDGYIYVRCRAISSRVNKNNDGWPSDELTKSFKTFIGRPIFVDHNNDDPNRTRGVIVDSRLHVDDDKTSKLDPYYATAPDNHKPPTWIELLLEVDSKTFPKLAEAIRKNHIDAVSMGANIERSICSVCGNEAISPAEYCSHVERKGAEFEVESSDGSKIRKKAYEDCYGVNFFEISFVFDPADETALISEKRGSVKEANGQCPHCNGPMMINEEGMPVCSQCGYDLRMEDGSPLPVTPYSQGDRGYYDRATGQQVAKVAAGDLYDHEEEGDFPGEDYGDHYEEPVNKQNEAQQVFQWRWQQLVDRGVDPQMAAQIAKQEYRGPGKGIQYQEFINYLDRGATPEQALQILTKKGSPLDDSSIYNELNLPTAHALDPRQAQEARDWLADLQWTNMGPEDFARLDDQTVAKAIDRYYDGGIQGFIEDARISSVTKDSSIYKHLVNKALQAYTQVFMQATGNKEDKEERAWVAAKNAIAEAGFNDLAFEIAHAAKERFDQDQYIYSKIKVRKKALVGMDSMPINTQERQINYQPQGDMVTAPQEVDTLRRDYQCPNCKSDNLITDSDGVMRCPTCDYSQPPKGLDNPDLSMHKQVGEQDGAEQQAQPQDPLDQILIRPRQMGDPLHPQNPINSHISEGVINRMDWKTVFNGATVDIPLAHPNGITLETYQALKEAGLTAKVTYPGGESTEIPTGNPVKDMMLTLRYQKEAGLEDASDLIVTVSAPTEEINQVLEIIQSGGTTSAVSPKKIVINPSSGPKSDEPQNPKVVKDQMKPVTSAPELEKEAEIITIELQPKDEEEVEETPEEPEVVAEVEEEEEETPEEHEEEDKESKLLAAFTLADELVEQGVLPSQNKLAFVSKLEEETLAQIEARKETVEMFKAAGIRKSAKTQLPRLPRLASFQSDSVLTEDPALDSIPDEAIFS